jgi:hypothetical protein
VTIDLPRWWLCYVMINLFMRTSMYCDTISSTLGELNFPSWKLMTFVIDFLIYIHSSIINCSHNFVLNKVVCWTWRLGQLLFTPTEQVIILLLYMQIKIENNLIFSNIVNCKISSLYEMYLLVYWKSDVSELLQVLFNSVVNNLISYQEVIYAIPLSW